MKLRKTDKLPEGRKDYGVVIETIKEFLLSGDEIAEVVNDEKEPLERLYNAFFINCQRHDFGVKVVRRNNRIYLVRENSNGNN